MGKVKAIIVLGFVMATVPYWGIPRDWKEYLMTFLGIVIGIVGIIFQRQFHILEVPRGEVKTPAFTESQNPTTTQ